MFRILRFFNINLVALFVGAMHFEVEAKDKSIAKIGRVAKVHRPVQLEYG